MGYWEIKGTSITGFRVQYSNADTPEPYFFENYWAAKYFMDISNKYSNLDDAYAVIPDKLDEDENHDFQGDQIMPKSRDKNGNPLYRDKETETMLKIWLETLQNQIKKHGYVD
jgi:hypothetical protein